MNSPRLCFVGYTIWYSRNQEIMKDEIFVSNNRLDISQINTLLDYIPMTQNKKNQFQKLNSLAQNIELKICIPQIHKASTKLVANILVQLTKM